MKIRLWLSLVIMFLVLTACAPVAAIPTEIQPTSTEMPAEATKTLTPTETPTEIPTSTPTSIPTLEGLLIPVPDPRITNPDFFDVSNANSPIVQFAEAFAIKPEDVTVGLDFEVKQDIHGNDFVVIRTPDGVALMMATQGENGEWVWQAATPGNYWGILGKHIGASINGYEWGLSNNKSLFIQHFSHGGILGLLGQVRPGPDIDERRPARATVYLRAAKQADMAFMFTYVVEPGKFPKNTTAENINQWLNRRLSEISDVITQNKPNRMVYLQFNEATNERGGWNGENNPLRNKYGNQWLGEYLYQALLIPIQHGLIPNKDYILLVNENSMFSTITQQFIHAKLKEARAYAFQKLMSDPVTTVKLSEMDIMRAEDIQIVLGTETYVNLDHRPRVINFITDPTAEQIDALANLFGDLGGIIMTEVSPHGTVEQKKEFFLKITDAMKNNPNIHGILLWNIFENPEDASDNFFQSPTLLFDSQGNPTELYYALLRH